MDEIGRGTSTYDGVALASACARYLIQKIQALTLFATHYFELTTLPETLPRVQNVHLDAVEHGDNIVFLHALRAGPANQSYGLQVATLAGIPKQVIKDAKSRLFELEQVVTETVINHHSNSNPQISLFSYSGVENLINKLNPDQMSPKEALEVIYKLKEEVGKV